MSPKLLILLVFHLPPGVAGVTRGLVVIAFSDAFYFKRSFSNGESKQKQGIFSETLYRSSIVIFLTPTLYFRLEPMFMLIL